jgi:catechol 2,3-dioxygenase-like lactoylglutathione lyase family enzyme
LGRTYTLATEGGGAILMKIHRLDHIHVYSEDPASSVHFYETCFGAEAIGETRTSRGGTMYVLRLGGLALVLAPYPPGAEPGTPSAYADGACQHAFGVAHFGLHVENLEDAVATVRRLGATILSEPREHAGLRFAYVGAPDGVVIELLQYGEVWASWLGTSQTVRHIGNE